MAKIHLLGAHETNHPWGFECRLVPALEAEGHEVVATDFRRRRAEVARLLRETPADLVVVMKGEGISAAAIRSAPAPTVLWYAEQIGSANDWDETALGRRAELAVNVAAFDLVLSHDASNLDVYRALGARRVEWLPTACADPAVHRPLGVERTVDVTFAGSLTPRRRTMLDMLVRRLPVRVVTEWNPVALNEALNRSRVVLNFHLSNLPNTETRVAEVLGAGACLVTESLSSPGLIEPGRHAIVVPTGDVEALTRAARDRLDDPEGSAAIAAAGREHVLAGHTFRHRARALVAAGLSLNRAA